MSLIGLVRPAVGLVLAQQPPVTTPTPGEVIGNPRDVEDIGRGFGEFFQSVQARLPYFLLALILLLLMVLFGRLVRRWVERWIQRSSTEAHVHLLVAKLAYAGMVGLGVLIALSVIGVNLGVLVGSLGLASLAVGFAMQNVLSNFVAGLVLLLEHPFTKGDYVITQEAEGTVEDIRIRATRLRTPDGQLVLVPNSLLSASVVTNASATSRRRLQVAVNVPYTEDPDQTRALLLEVTRTVEGVVDDPEPQVLTQDFGQGAVQMLLWFWVNPTTVDMLRVRSQVLEVIERTLKEADVDLAVPTYMATVQPDEMERRPAGQAAPFGSSQQPARGQVAVDRDMEPAAKRDTSEDDGRRDAGHSPSGDGRTEDAESSPAGDKERRRCR